MTKAMEMTTNNTNKAITTINNDLAQRWINFVDVRPKSKSTYDTAIKQLFKYFAENNITQPARQDIINFRDEMLKTRKPTTTALYLTAAKLFFRWLSIEGIYNNNIADHIKNPRIDKGHKKDALSAKQVATLLKSVNTSSLGGLRDRAILALMASAALRTIEIQRCNIEDLHEVAGRYYLQVQGKGHDDRNDSVLVPTQVYKAICEYLQARGEVELSAPLFASVASKNYGQRLTTQSISRIAKQQLRSIGIDSRRYTAHSLRHSAISLSILNGATLEQASQMARHSSISVTMIYNHTIQRLQNQSEQLAADAIFNFM